jgi:hypothetical protein
MGIYMSLVDEMLLALHLYATLTHSCRCGPMVKVQSRDMVASVLDESVIVGFREEGGKREPLA